MCSVCSQEKPLEEFYPAPKGKDGRKSLCKQCQKDRDRAYYENHRDRVIERTASRRQADPDRSRAERGAYYLRHAEAIKSKVRARAQGDPEKVREEQRRSYHKNREKRSQQRRERYRDDPIFRETMKTTVKAWLLAHPEKRTEQSRKWRAKNPLRARQLIEDYRHRLEARYVEPVSLEAIYERDGGICHLCGLPVDRQDASPDHVVPMSLGGFHAMWNVKLSHWRCNRRKNNSFTPAYLILKKY
jgi:5-methylcytosine-specific restriction endonuclease McrA